MKYYTSPKWAAFLAVFIVLALRPIVSSAQGDIAAATDSTAQQITQAVLTLTVSDLKNRKGQLLVSVYNDSDKWLSVDKVAEEILLVVESISEQDSEQGEGVIMLNMELPVGEYAVSVYHDLNSNGKLDSNFIGIPKEPTVVSNNAPARFGPPKYEDAKFTLGADGTEQKLRFK